MQDKTKKLFLNDDTNLHVYFTYDKDIYKATNDICKRDGLNGVYDTTIFSDCVEYNKYPSSRFYQEICQLQGGYVKVFMFPIPFAKIDITSDYYLERFDDFLSACRRYTKTYKQPIVIVAPMALDECVSALTE